MNKNSKIGTIKSTKTEIDMHKLTGNKNKNSKICKNSNELKTT
jgi:hypothetical protein